MRQLFKNGKINGRVMDIQVEDGVITAIGIIQGEGIDLGGNTVYPGLIDVHNHGCLGYEFAEGTYDIQEMSDFLAKHGTTSWLPSNSAVPMEDIMKAVNGPLPKTGSANVLGYHLEGPYLSKEYAGAQNPDYVKAPDLEEFFQCENVKLVTVAPELEGALDFIKNCKTKVALGHTSADYDLGIKAIEAGADSLCHTFNAMPPLHHRNPGVIGAAIEKNIYVQVICDGMHVHPAVVKMLYKTFGPERMIVITDAISATGYKEGEYMIGGLKTIVKDKLARLEDGTIAGSTATMLQCMKNLVSWGIPAEDAFRMGAQTPAEYLDVPKGKLDVEYDADFIVVDENLELKMCVIGGKVYGE